MIYVAKSWCCFSYVTRKLTFAHPMVRYCVCPWLLGCAHRIIALNALSWLKLFMTRRNLKLIFDGGQWRQWCLSSCTSKSMEAWRVETFPVLLRQKYSSCCLQMDWNFRFGMPVCSAGFLSSRVLYYFLWCGYLCIEFVDWVLVTSRWSWAGTFWWAVSTNKRFGWVQTVHSPPPWVQVLVIVLPFIIFNLFV